MNVVSVYLYMLTIVNTSSKIMKGLVSIDKLHVYTNTAQETLYHTYVTTN